MHLIDMTQNDTPSFDYDLFKGQGLDSVQVAPFPSSIVKVEPYAIDEG